MSSMRNSVQRRNHKERAQPEERKKWGLLEKRKDYKLRASDHKAKQARLKILKEKASERNPDEFSFGMMSSSVDKAGRKVADRGNKSLGVDVVKLLKTQDAGYIRTMLQMVRKEREELEKRLVLGEEEARVLKDGEEGRRGKHTVYVGKKEEQEQFGDDEWFGKGGELPGRRGVEEQQAEEDDEEDMPKAEKKLSKKQQEALAMAQKQERAFMSKRERAQERAAAHLEAVKKRERDLMAAEEELEIQRAKMQHTVGGVNKNGVKFKIRERKR
ncbi:U3 snoRNP-associated protein Utp11 [Bimuria novae-zelandiae CBS 107.79]|uniref:U3 small nucleolar RNA-associated protein 11 n=1 Tax=Bimuria novae-zelandiae CBS 107.79 TaxID=1447943 RepID=A0A6A5UN41_9PLEO|nr:U3 snoRNP-associated protein Utp11 [Bimuria novae-zelandiae CBS 107.79]